MGRIRADREFKEEFQLNANIILGTYDRKGQEGAYKSLASLKETYEGKKLDHGNASYLNRNIRTLTKQIGNQKEMDKLVKKEKYNVREGIKALRDVKWTGYNGLDPIEIKRMKEESRTGRNTQDLIKRIEEESETLLKRGTYMGLNVSGDIKRAKRHVYRNSIDKIVSSYESGVMTDLFSLALHTRHTAPSIHDVPMINDYRDKIAVDKVADKSTELAKYTLHAIEELAEKAVECGASKKGLDRKIREYKHYLKTPLKDPSTRPIIDSDREGNIYRKERMGDFVVIVKEDKKGNVISRRREDEVYR
ncbi:MAG: hypothetical protein U9Q92_04840 [archaeon]|nr:hypothetical protein [archaeon]